MIAAVNGVPCSYLSVIRQRAGSAVLSAILSEPADVTGEINASISGVQVFSGTVQRSGSEHGLPKIMVHDGVPLRRTLPGRYYQGATRRIIAGDILRAVNLTGDVQVPGTTVRYVRKAASAREQLADLLEGTGALWRTRPDGSVYVGPESWALHPAVKWQEDLNGYQPEQGRLQLLPTPTLLPGMTLPANPNDDQGDFNVTRVEHIISAQQLVTFAWT